MTEPEVLFSELSCANHLIIGVASLNRPKQLNALNLGMCEALLTQLRIWQSRTDVVVVIIKGEGEKGFCAGGDVAQVVKHIRAGGPDRYVYGDSFFTVEYALDLLIHTYTKPIVSWAHGVTMGGGVGISVGASHRFVADKSRIAMPEIHIGLFPDVGGGWFLNRMPGASGLLMALTGMMINEADAIFGGLADYYAPHTEQGRFIESLVAINWGATAQDQRHQMTHHCREFSKPYSDGLPRSILRDSFEAFREAVSRAKVTGVIKGLNELAAKNPAFETAAANLQNGSPTAAAVVFEYMRRTRLMSLQQVLQLDLILAKQFARRHDFPEGVRALLIDKDKRPQWLPKSHNNVTPQIIAEHFDC